MPFYFNKLPCTKFTFILSSCKIVRCGCRFLIRICPQMRGIKTNKKRNNYGLRLIFVNRFTSQDTIFSCDQAALQMVFSVRPSVCPSVRLSVCLSHLFHHVPIIVSSWNFQELLPWSKVMSMQKVKVSGQRSRSQRSTPNLALSGL